MNVWVEYTSKLAKKIESEISFPESVKHNGAHVYLQVEGGKVRVKTVQKNQEVDSEFPINLEIQDKLIEILEADLADSDSTQNKIYDYPTVEVTEELKEKVKNEVDISLYCSTPNPRVYLVVPGKFCNTLNFDVCYPGSKVRWSKSIQPSERLAEIVAAEPTHKVTWY